MMAREACLAGGSERFKSNGHNHTGKQNHPCQTYGRSSVDHTMREALLYLLTSFWLGAAHAATPGHGKTIAAAYIVGARGHPVDALILGIFVTLSHTSGIVLVAVLASLGLPGLVPQHVEAYLSLLTGLLVVVIGLWMLWAQRPMPPADGSTPHPGPAPDQPDHHHVHGPGTAPHAHRHGDEDGAHTHGWGLRHTHRLDVVTQDQPKLLVLLGLGIAGGILPDPAALAILLSALAHGQIMLSLGTVLVFSLGFASTLVVVGVVAAQMGQVVLAWLSGPWVARLQTGTALLITVVGVVLTVSAWRLVSALT
jgi:nickel/cobalt exporter